MKFAASFALASSALIATAAAQVSYDNSTGTWSCPVADGAYCAGDSLSTPVVILCTNGTGIPGNCIPHNWNRPPITVYYSACYQSSPTAGDAACAKSCTVYPDSGAPFAVPGSCNATYYDEIDVTGGAVTVSCSNGANGTSCTDTMHANATSNSSNATSVSSSSSYAATTGPAGPQSTSPSASASAKPTGAASNVVPVVGYAALGLLAFAL